MEKNKKAPWGRGLVGESAKGTAREDTTKFLDELEPTIQEIKRLLWGSEGRTITAEEFSQMQTEAKRLKPIAIEARKWIDGHGSIIQRRMRTRNRKGTVGDEHQEMIDRLNIADLTLRSFLSMVEVVEREMTGGLQSLPRLLV